ncbi:shikimate dehydrogenase [Brevibacterium salitolerans]|uniref:Shikimate dehydrogenase n=1 Tax=Brevibacterium salitolerans TaxID=1403566 RepID=A0ABN2WHE7_9MICO
MGEAQPGAAHCSFGVAGSPIAHSLSPLLHHAAAARLGLRDFSYGRVELTAERLEGWLDAQPGLRGLSLTMPLKHRLVELARSRGWVPDAAVEATGAANTLLLDPDTGMGEILNTDVAGIVAAIREGAEVSDGAGDRTAVWDEVDVLGAGATAGSALAAAAELGATRAQLFVRNRTRAAAAREVAEAVGIRAVVRDLPDWVPGERALTLSTLPAGAMGPGGVDHPLPAAIPGIVFDAGYAPAARGWQESLRAHGALVVDGSRMLLHQAVAQHVRFAALAGLPAGRAEAARADVRAAMDAALRSR